MSNLIHLFSVTAEYFSALGALNSLLNAFMMTYGMAFVFNVICLLFVVRHFLYLYNMQTGENYVISSSSAFDEKGAIPMKAWLMLLIPYFYVGFIMYYAYKLKKLYPAAKVNIQLYWILSLGLSLLCLFITAFLDYSLALNLEYSNVVISLNWKLFPNLFSLGAMLACYLMLNKTLKENFYLPESKDE